MKSSIVAMVLDTSAFQCRKIRSNRIFIVKHSIQSTQDIFFGDTEAFSNADLVATDLPV